MCKSGGFVFFKLEEINSRPEPFEFYTANELWTDEHTSKQMLAYHLNGEIDVSSRRTVTIDRSIEWITDRFELGAGKRSIDFGCGPGLYTLRLARTRAQVTGIDFSGRYIEYARKAAENEGLAIRYVNENYLDYMTEEKYDLITMIMCDFCALSPQQRKGLLTKFHSILEPGGSVLLDVYSHHAFDQREETASYELNQLNGFWSPHRYYGFVNTFKYDQEKVVLDKYTIIEEGRTRTVYNWLQYFSTETLKREFEENGFSEKEFYADVTGSPFDPKGAEFAVVARKV